MSYARVVADSTYADGVRLTTIEAKIHRFTLAELNTHRVFSRNSASSRAIPVRKQLERVLDEPAYPVSWPAEQKGMQGGEELGDDVLHTLTDSWDRARDAAVEQAMILHAKGLHKSVVNRLLEPFMWHTVVITATAWENFFLQRVSKLAQPELFAAADAMMQAYDASKPTYLKPNQWHLPYVDEEDWDHVRRQQAERYDAWNFWLTRVSAARCARTSYLTQNGTRDHYIDVELYNRLTTAQPIHWSPLEHVATPWPENRQEGTLTIPLAPTMDGVEDLTVDLSHLPKVGNLLGWRSLRTTVEAEQGVRTYR